MYRIDCFITCRFSTSLVRTGLAPVDGEEWGIFVGEPPGLGTGGVSLFEAGHWRSEETSIFQ